MKQVMKSLKHNGIYVPEYDYKGFSIKIKGTTIKLSAKSEQMAIAWIRKTMSLTTPPDKVFMKNFMQEFLEQLKQENPALQLLGSFTEEYLKNIDAAEPEDVTNPDSTLRKIIDFAEVEGFEHVVVRAFFHGRAGRFHGGIAGHDDGHQLGHDFARFPYQLNAVHFGHHDICEEHHEIAIRNKHIEGGPAIGSQLHGETLIGQDVVE